MRIYDILPVGEENAIPGEEMSRKFDRVGEITGKILDYQRQNPAKAGQLRQFLN